MLIWTAPGHVTPPSSEQVTQLAAWLNATQTCCPLGLTPSHGWSAHPAGLDTTTGGLHVCP